MKFDGTGVYCRYRWVQTRSRVIKPLEYLGVCSSSTVGFSTQSSLKRRSWNSLRQTPKSRECARANCPAAASPAPRFKSARLGKAPVLRLQRKQSYTRGGVILTVLVRAGFKVRQRFCATVMLTLVWFRQILKFWRVKAKAGIPQSFRGSKHNRWLWQKLAGMRNAMQFCRPQIRCAAAARAVKRKVVNTSPLFALVAYAREQRNKACALRGAAAGVRTQAQFCGCQRRMLPGTTHWSRSSGT